MLRVRQLVVCVMDRLLWISEGYSHVLEDRNRFGRPNENVCSISDRVFLLLHNCFRRYLIGQNGCYLCTGLCNMFLSCAMTGYEVT